MSTLATIVAEFGDYSRQCGQGFIMILAKLPAAVADAKISSYLANSRILTSHISPLLTSNKPTTKLCSKTRLT